MRRVPSREEYLEALGILEPHREIDGVWTCSICGKRARWNREWSWWGTLDSVVALACSDACRDVLSAKLREIGEPEAALAVLDR